MWFMARVAFWLSIVILLLPAPPSPQAVEPQFNATQALSAAIAAVSDMRQFCARQPDARGGPGLSEQLFRVDKWSVYRG